METAGLNQARSPFTKADLHSSTAMCSVMYVHVHYFSPRLGEDEVLCSVTPRPCRFNYDRWSDSPPLPITSQLCRQETRMLLHSACFNPEEAGAALIDVGVI